MTDEEYEEKKRDLARLLDNLRLIKDRGRQKWLILEIRALLEEILENL